MGCSICPQFVTCLCTCLGCCLKFFCVAGKMAVSNPRPVFLYLTKKGKKICLTSSIPKLRKYSDGLSLDHDLIPEQMAIPRECRQRPGKTLAQSRICAHSNTWKSMSPTRTANHGYKELVDGEMFCTQKPETPESPQLIAATCPYSFSQTDSQLS